MVLPFFLAAAAATASAAATPSRPPPSVRALYGRWQVVGVAVPDTGVQALAENDPAYIGRRLTFSAARLTWDSPKDASTERPCAAPRIVPARRDPDPDARATVHKVGGPALRAFSVGCRQGSWGPVEPPSPAILSFRDGSIALWWFDNALLKLRRAR